MSFGIAPEWGKQATDQATTGAGKAWKVLLIPHDIIAENGTLEWFGQRFEHGA